MSKIAVSPNGSGTGTYTLASPNNNASHTLTLPVATGELLVNTSTGVSVTGDLSFGDNDKAIFGNSSDLQLYHDGSNSFISDQGLGSLKLLASSFYLNNAADTENIIVASQNGGVALFYNDVAKFATSSNGANVSGTMTATAFAGDGSGLTGVGAITTAGAVGTYMWARGTGSTTAAPAFNFGTTYAGSSLHPAGFASTTSAISGGSWYYSGSSSLGIAIGPTATPARSGTWRCMGQTTAPTFDENPTTLFVRIS